MFPFIPIAAALLATALQASTGAPGAKTANSAERLARALAAWELLAATSGEDAEVAAALESLVVDAHAAVAATPADTALAREAEAIEAARARFRTERGLERPAAQEPQQGSRDPRASDEEVIAMAILNHLHAGASAEHQGAMLRFGARAVPALISSARSMNAANALGAPAIALDTLALLDTQKTLEMCWELSAQPSFLVRRAIAEVLSRRNVYDLDEVWLPQGNGDHLPAVPAWGQLVERLLTEPAVAPQHLRSVLVSCARRGFMPRAVLDALLTFDDLDEFLQVGFVPPATQQLYVAGMRHSNASVRQHCADRVSHFPDVTPLFALHSDQDVMVRRTVAMALGERNVQKQGLARQSFTSVAVPPQPGPEHQKALEACLADENESVRSAARSAVEQVYLQLKLQLVSPAELARLATSSAYADVKLPLLWCLASSSPELVAGVAEHMLSHPALRATDESFYNAFDALLSGTKSAAHAPAIATAVLAALEAHATPHEWGRVLDHDTNVAPPLLVHLPDDLRVQLVRSLARHRPSAAWRLRDWWRSVPHDTALWRTLVLDAAASPLARAVAIGWSLEEVAPSPEHLAASVDAVRRLAQEEAPSRPDWRQFAGWLERVVSDGAARGLPRHLLFGALFADPSVPDELLLNLRIHNARIDENRAELVRAVLARYPRASWRELPDTVLFVDVLSAAHTLDREQRVVLIEGALLSGSRTWWPHALEATGRARDPELLDVLRRFTDRLTNDDFTPGVASTAASYLSDDAAKLILDLAARTSNSERRALILASLQQVIDYQTALAKWQQRNDATAVRVRAIGELVTVIDDPSVPEAQRAEALRGLGLLGAVEELPRLVRTLSAPSDALRSAAREALDRLNAAPVK